METLLACLTPPGKAAIATLAVRGPLAWTVTRELFQPIKGRLPEEPVAGKYWYGKIGTDYADEIILAVKDGAPIPCVELHCHGGVEVVRMIQELYEARGVSPAPWQQFLDSPAAIFELLARAPTTRTAGILLDQANAAWQRCLEAKPDVETVRRLEALCPLGQHLVEPWKVVIAGAPNVGKSSLMNALTGYTRSIVSPIPGTTRDAVTARLAIDSWPVEMIDTAGIRVSDGALESQGIERTYAALRKADLRLWLLDGSTPPALPEMESGWHFVINKIDLPAGWDWQRMPFALRISAQTQAGLLELCEVISRQLVPHPPAPGDAVPCLPEHREWLAGRASDGFNKSSLARPGNDTLG